MIYNWLSFDQFGDKWWIVYPDGSRFSGPYKTAVAAKSELAKYRKAEIEYEKRNEER